MIPHQPRHRRPRASSAATGRAWSALLLIALALTACRGTPDEALRQREHALEARVLAPCCWRQSLRDHESESAHELRQEVHRRLAAGESEQTIEQDLIARYGERIRALPADGDPRWMIVALMAALAGAGLIAITRLVRPRSAALLGVPSGAGSDPRARPAAAAPRADSAAYDQRLDDDLADVD